MHISNALRLLNLMKLVPSFVGSEPMQAINNRILVIDDHPAIHTDFKNILCPAPVVTTESSGALFLAGTTASSAPAAETQNSFRVESVFQGNEGVRKVEQACAEGDPFALAFVDMRMPPGPDGLTTIENLWRIDPDLHVVLCSVCSDFAWSEIQRRIGQTDQLLILKKPFDHSEVNQLVVAMTEKWRLTQESRRAAEERITKLKLTEESLDQRTRMLQLATSVANVGYWAYDTATESLDVSDGTLEILGVSDDSVPNLDAMVELFPDLTRQTVKSRLHSAIADQSEFELKSYFVRPDQQARHLQLRVICESQNGTRPSVFGVIQDVTKDEEAVMAIRHASLHDPLTCLSNRSKFHSELDTALLSARSGGSSVALILLDVDRFKTVNDSLGHPVGDGLLKAIARRLQETVRSSETVGRLGGDEFAILQPIDNGYEQTLGLLKRVYSRMNEPFDINGKKITATVSAGIALAPENANDSDQLIKSADIALYRAKKDGRGVHRFFNESMDLHMQTRRGIELDLQTALQGGQFELFYQPIVNAGTSLICGMETLIRWNHPVRGLVRPDVFVSIAEETGEIIQIGRWVLEQACLVATDWPDHVTISVNVSSVQFQQDDLFAAVQKALEKTGLSPNRLEIEITETAFLVDNDSTLKTLHRLRDIGVRIAMDDFGIGYSSLSYLRSFPFDKLKLDKSFVLDSADRPEAQAIIRAVAGLGKSLGMQTCAEGVETFSQCELVCQEGYTHLQGYLFGRPQPTHLFGEGLFDLAQIEAGIDQDELNPA